MRLYLSIYDEPTDGINTRTWVCMHACVRVSICSMRREVRPRGYLIDNVFPLPLPSSSLLVENENDGACIEKRKKEKKIELTSKYISAASPSLL